MTSTRTHTEQQQQQPQWIATKDSESFGGLAVSRENLGQLEREMLENMTSVMAFHPSDMGSSG